MLRPALLLSLLLVCPLTALGQDAAGKTGTAATAPAPASNTPGETPAPAAPVTYTWPQIGLCIGILCFTLIVLGIFAYMRSNGSMGPDSSFKLMGLILVVGSALFVLAMGASQPLVTAIIGLLGTALGYIFGKNMGTDTTQRDLTTPNPRRGP